MRVDFVITELFVGGAERCLTELAIGLAESGDSVRVFSVGPLPTGVKAALVDRLEEHEITVTSGGGDSLRRTAGVYRKLKNWLGSDPPDICQTFMFHANVLGTYAAKAVGVPVRVGGLRVAESRPMRNVMERSAAKRMDSMVCVSSAVAQFAKHHFGNSCPLTTIGNGVDVTRFATAPAFDWTSLGWPDDVDVSLFVGRFHPQKGIELLQKEIEAIAPRDSKRRLLLVGDGPLRSDLENWASSIGSNRVQCLPWQSDVAPLMSASRLLVLPSHYEGMPNVVLEAMAAGIPVVCSQVEGSKELLSHAFAQQSFPSGDASAMKKLVETIMSDELLRAELGSDNRDRVKRDFSIAAMIDAYRRHYRDRLAVRRLEV